MKPLATAHSGCENTFPNSLESLEAAAAYGADVAEFDIRMSKDHVIVLSHDDFWILPGSGSGKTGDLSGKRETPGKSIATNAYSVLGGIATLEEVTSLAKEKNIILNLDIKDFSAIGETVSLVKKCGYEHGVIYSGYSPEQVLRLRSDYPSTGFMVNISVPFVDQETVLLYDRDRKAFADKVTEIYRKTGGICLNMNHTCCDPEMIHILRKRFVPVSVWTVDDKELMKSYSGSEAWSITTKRIKELISILNS